MPFFDAVDEDGTVEQHAREVQSIQKSQAQELIAYYRDARRELMDRLAHARYESFTAQHLRGVLAQVNAALTVMNSRMQDDMKKGTIESAMTGVKHLIREIHKFSQRFTGAVEPINLDVVKVSLDTQNFLFNQYEVSVKKYDSDVRARIARGLTQAAIQEKPYSEVISTLGKFWDLEEWQLHRLVRTEQHHAYSLAKFNGMKETKRSALPDLKKALFHPMDSRTGQDSIELAEENPILPLDQPFKQVYRPRLKSGRAGKKQVYVFMVPPNRPNDRAILIPYRDAWGE